MRALLLSPGHLYLNSHTEMPGGQRLISSLLLLPVTNSPKRDFDPQKLLLHSSGTSTEIKASRKIKPLLLRLRELVIIPQLLLGILCFCNLDFNVLGKV